uniref:Plexin_cytopl domain-containing protein n=1 Tax=Macrostomum lignano TaxID=282301 RepID=A0A1I8FCE0_9PLAT
IDFRDRTGSPAASWQRWRALDLPSRCACDCDKHSTQAKLKLLDVRLHSAAMWRRRGRARLPLHEEQVTGPPTCVTTETPTLMHKSHSSKSLIDNGLTPKSPALTPGGGALATVPNQPGGGGLAPRARSKGIPPSTITSRRPYNGSLNVAGAVGQKKSKQADRTASRQCRRSPTCPFFFLLSTKKNLTDNITDLFGAHAPVPSHEPACPWCIKYLFDQLETLPGDTEFTRDAAHIWKSNAPAVLRSRHSPDRSAPSQRGCSSSKRSPDFHPKVEAYYAAVRSGSGSAKNENAGPSFKNSRWTSRSCSPFCRTALLASCIPQSSRPHQPHAEF